MSRCLPWFRCIVITAVCCEIYFFDQIFAFESLRCGWKGQVRMSSFLLYLVDPPGVLRPTLFPARNASSERALMITLPRRTGAAQSGEANDRCVCSPCPSLRCNVRYRSVCIKRSSSKFQTSGSRLSQSTLFDMVS